MAWTGMTSPFTYRNFGPVGLKIKQRATVGPRITRWETLLHIIYRVSQEECARLRESVPYVKVYRYNTKHVYPKLNGYGDNGQRNVRASCGSTYFTCSADALEVHCACPWDWNAVNIVPACPCKVLGTLRTTTALMRVFMYFNILALCHSYVNYMLSTDISITETTYSCQF